MISTGKHEFLGGEIYAMPSGSEEHSALAAEIVRLLGNAVGDRPCRVCGYGGFQDRCKAQVL
ncbi:MAG: putative restriction endonuclease [Thermoanaerobaculia bacterium]|nr:putative restriction endonuclease [Thermoanaerobaculia bacterium]